VFWRSNLESQQNPSDKRRGADQTIWIQLADDRRCLVPTLKRGDIVAARLD
jgi:hypothetical protein